MQSFLQTGTRLDYKPGTEVEVDSVVTLKTRIGIATTTIPAGDTGALAVMGVFELPSVSAKAFEVGDELYWNGSALTTDKDNGLSGDDKVDYIKAGWAFTAKMSSAVMAEVKIG